MFMQLFLSKVHPACYNIANDIKPRSNSKKTAKHADDCSKAVFWGCRMIYEKCINCSYNNVDKSIRLLDRKKTNFVNTGKNSCKKELLKDLSS